MIRRVARPLLYGGTVVIVLALARFHAAYIGHYSLHATDPSRLGWTLGFIGLLLVACYGAGLPELPRTSRQALTSAVVAPVAAAGAVSVVQLIAGDALLPRFVVFGAALLLVPWNLVCYAVSRSGRVRGERRDRVFLVASDAEAQALRDELEHNHERPAVLVRTIRPTDSVSGGTRSKPLCEQVLDARASVVVLERTALQEPSIVAQAAALHEAGVRIRPLRLFYSEWLGKLPISELERASLLFDIREVHGSRYLRVKRLLDIVVSLAGVVVLVIAIPFVAVGDLVANRGPLFYRQERVGKNGRRFQILKFRTMRPAAGSGNVANEWTAEDDPRITRFGRVLRKTHVDELPQMINILRGDLSLVGPRPEQPHYVEELAAKLPFYSLRHLVRPGLTGWAQVNYGYAGDEHDALEKLQYEFWYLEHQRLLLDARVIGRTIRTVVRRHGR